MALTAECICAGDGAAIERRYVEGQYKGDMMGTPFDGRGLMGFDNLSGKFQTTLDGQHEHHDLLHDG